MGGNSVFPYCLPLPSVPIYICFDLFFLFVCFCLFLFFLILFIYLYSGIKHY